MTENNASQESSIRDAIHKAYDDGYNDAKMDPDGTSTYSARAAARQGTDALLSKLRAPVADERADVDLSELAIKCGAVISTDDLSWNFSYSAMRNFCIRARAALASAPVAGKACAWFTEDHLTDKSATTWDRAVAERWRAKGWPVQSLYAAPQASEADALIDALGQCRDAFPLPDIVGSKLDLLWQEAMSDPSAVPAYIKARAALSAQPSGNPGELAAQPGAQKTGGSE